MKAMATADRRAARAADGITSLPGIGPAVATAFDRLGLQTLQDLWFHLPLRYEDRTRITAIRDLHAGETAQVEARIEAIESGFRYRPQLRIAVTDDSQQTLVLRFFHFNRAQVNQLAVGARLRCFGEVRHGNHGLEMVHPEYRRVADDGAGSVDDRLTPIYPTTEGLGQKRLGGAIRAALTRLPPDDALELIPPELRKVHKLSSLRDALLYVHTPPPDADLGALALGMHPAQRRLVFEELLTHHLSLKRLRAQLRSHAAPPLQGDGALRRRFRAALAFKPTHAQERVAAEIARDLAKPLPMLRLVQGDVGSGKTLVAAQAALTAIEAGRQAALMAPTELLAEQHFINFDKWLAPLGIRIAWLGGKLKGRARTAALASVAETAQLVIGTHALMQEGVAFRDLALVIIDEQHRFGVHQRLALRDKGRSGDIVPHQLVLTATPIPRTLAMTAYADLDVSVIDELPPGRTPVATVALANTRRAEIVERIRSACAEGRQAYWVCTLIEESDLLQAQAAEATFAELTAALAGIRVGFVHGRMKPAEKQAACSVQGGRDRVARCHDRDRGRRRRAECEPDDHRERRAPRPGPTAPVARSGRPRQREIQLCTFVPAALSASARQRLDVLRESSDGFRIAEKDLELRGPGEVLGTRQTGQLAMRIADLARDAALLPAVQRAGSVLLRDHPDLVERLIERWIGAATRFAGA
jgi:ATP-dependent DNA helicase RecG